MGSKALEYLIVDETVAPQLRSAVLDVLPNSSEDFFIRRWLAPDGDFGRELPSAIGEDLAAADRVALLFSGKVLTAHLVAQEMKSDVADDLIENPGPVGLVLVILDAKLRLFAWLIAGDGLTHSIELGI